MHKKLQKCLPLLSTVVNGGNLSVEQTQKILTNTFQHDRDGYFFTALISALHAKGETADELLGFIKTHHALTPPLKFSAPVNKTIELSGTGGGSFKSINVSTAASFVVAASGYTVPKATYFSITGTTGSGDVFKHFGIDITTLSKRKIELLIDAVGICPFYTPTFSPKMKNRGALVRKIFLEHGIKIQTPFHLVTNAFSPFPIEHRIYGCYSKKYLKTIAELFAKLKFKKSLTVHGNIGMPELSIVGDSIIAEQIGKKIRVYSVTPQTLGVRKTQAKDLVSGTRRQNISRFTAVLKGAGSRADTDLVAVNAGAALYTINDVKTLEEGTVKAQAIIATGEPFEILRDLSRRAES